MDSKPVMDVSGWEAFVHGVFAIAVTLLVLDIRVPDVASIDSGSALLRALFDEMPRYGAYVLGFLCLGTYWINVHRAMRMLRGIDHGYIVIGLLFLMVIAAVPFVTALLAEYIGAGNGRDQVALVVFTSWQLVLSVLAHISIRYAFYRRQLLVKASISEASQRAWVRLTALGPLIWLVALATALLANGTITLVLIAFVFALFMFEVPIREEPGDVGAAQ
jgi:uncharacterized membrane protein